MKNLRTIILLFIANSISSIAQGMSMIAIPWYFVKIGKSQLFVTIFLGITLTSLVWGPLAGTFVDKYNRKNIFLFLTTTVGLLIASIAAYGISNEVMNWELTAIVFAATFLNYNLHYPNLYAFLQEIIEPKHYGRITSFVEIQGQVSAMLAGAAAAILLEGIPNGTIDLFGMAYQLPFTVPKLELYEIFALDAGTYFIAFLLIIFMKYVPLAERKMEAGSLINRFKTGLTYLKANPKVMVFGIASYMVFAALLVSTFSLFALYVKAHLDAPANTYALGEMAYSLGAILAGIAIQRIFSKMKKVYAVIIMTLMAMLSYAILASFKLAMLFYVISIFIGLTNAGVRIIRTTYLFEVVPNQVYGRIGSIFFVSNIMFRLFFLSLFSLPFFHTSNNVIYAFWAFTVFLSISAGILSWNEHRKIPPTTSTTNVTFEENL